MIDHCQQDSIEGDKLDQDIVCFSHILLTSDVICGEFLDLNPTVADTDNYKSPHCVSNVDTPNVLIYSSGCEIFVLQDCEITHQAKNIDVSDCFDKY